jgi:glycosyltransferase involved in cell wall biosynthesis
MSYAVVVPSCNRPELLKRAIASIFAQSRQPDHVSLVIDEPEDWGKYDFIRGQDERLQVTFTGGGKGGARARNLGLDQVTSEYVFFLDDDDAWLPLKMEKQLGLLERRPDCVGVTCWRNSIDEKHGTCRITKFSEKRLNRHIMYRNLTGSFSFFGFRRNSETRLLRLEANLPASQDMEFYMALSEYGAICVADEPLVNYFEHEGDRITGRIETDLQAFTLIEKKYAERCSFRTRMWLRGRVNAYRAATADTFTVFLSNFSLTLVRFLIAGKCIALSGTLIIRALGRHVKRICSVAC